MTDQGIVAEGFENFFFEDPRYFYHTDLTGDIPPPPPSFLLPQGKYAKIASGWYWEWCMETHSIGPAVYKWRPRPIMPISQHFLTELSLELGVNVNPHNNIDEFMEELEYKEDLRKAEDWPRTDCSIIWAKIRREIDESNHPDLAIERGWGDAAVIPYVPYVVQDDDLSDDEGYVNVDNY